MEQIKKNKKVFTILLLSALGGLILFAIFSMTLDAPFLIAVYLVIAVICLALFYYLKITKPFKENIIPEVLKEYKPTLEFIPTLTEKQDYIDLIRTNKLIPSATSFQFTDGIIDDYESNKIISFDLHATHTQSNGKSSTTVTDFKGRFYDIEYKGFACNFIIKEEILKRIPEGYTFLELEHIESNNVFNIYVTDKHEAFKVFTPSVIKKYYELAGTDEFKTITHHKDGHLYIYIYNSENLFENSGDDYKEAIINDYKKQYEDALEYINIFNYYELD